MDIDSCYETVILHCSDTGSSSWPATLDPRFNELIFRRIPHGIFTVDQDGHITSFNPAAEEITGWRQDEVLGRLCRDILRADRCHEACFLRSSMTGDEPHRDQEATITTRDGRELLVAISTASLKDVRRAGWSAASRCSATSRCSCVCAGRSTAAYTGDDIVSRSEAMQRRARDAAAGGQEQEHGAGRGRTGHGQGARRAGHPQPRPASGRALRGGQLRRAARHPGRVGALRLRARRLHRRPPRQAGALRPGPGRHALPGRDRRDLAGRAGQAAARPAGARVHAAGRGQRR